MTTARILEAKADSVLTFREDLLGTQYYRRSPAPELSAFEGQLFKVTKVTAEGIFGQAIAFDSKEILSSELLIELDKDVFKLNQ